MGIPYIRIVGFAYPLQVFAVLISFLMRSTERVKAPLISSILALITNFILNWILIYGRFGMPKMERPVQRWELLFRNRESDCTAHLPAAG